MVLVQYECCGLGFYTFSQYSFKVILNIQHIDKRHRVMSSNILELAEIAFVPAMVIYLYVCICCLGFWVWELVYI